MKRHSQIKLAYYSNGAPMEDLKDGDGSWEYRPYRIIETVNVPDIGLSPGVWLTPEQVKRLMAEGQVLIVEGR